MLRYTYIAYLVSSCLQFCVENFDVFIKYSELAFKSERVFWNTKRDFIYKS
jgi:hypothetical protein